VIIGSLDQKSRSNTALIFWQCAIKGAQCFILWKSLVHLCSDL